MGRISLSPPPLSPSLPRDEQSEERRNELADREDDRRELGVPVTKKMEGSRRGCAGNREEEAARGTAGVAGGGGGEERDRSHCWWWLRRWHDDPRTISGGTKGGSPHGGPTGSWARGGNGRHPETPTSGYCLSYPVAPSSLLHRARIPPRVHASADARYISRA
jgi:hypothetical protein